MFDLVTVTFPDEFGLQKLQAISVNRFLDENSLRSIVVIINDWDVDGDYKRYFDLNILPFYGRFSDKVLVFNASCFISKRSERLGWHSQQFLKLKAVIKCSSRHALILDSKNHFTRMVSFSNFFDTSTFLPFTHLEKRSLMDKYLIPALDTFHIKDFNEVEVMPCVTPYAINKDLVVSMIEHLEKQMSVDFEYLFLTQNRLLTEFYLIYAFVYYSGKITDQFSLRVKPNFLTFFSLWPNTDDQREFALRRMFDDDVVCVGLHRNRLSKLCTREVDAFLKLWTDCGLFSDKKSANKFIQSLVGDKNGI